MNNKQVDTHIWIFDWLCNINTCNVRLKINGYNTIIYLYIMCLFYVLKWYYFSINAMI